MATPTDPILPSSLATALATRTTDAVIADLKRHATNAPVISINGRLQSRSSGQSDLSELDELSLQVRANVDVDDDEGGEEEGNEDEGVKVSKPRKITEKKRRLNAIADSYIQERNHKMMKEANEVRPEDEANQSARWLVNQSEDRQIISSPREYQVELFEKAKEKNIIAVLDTGQ